MCHNCLVGVGGKVFASVFGLALGTLEIYLTQSVGEVEAAVIVRGAFLGSEAEVAADVLHKDGAEVLKLTVVCCLVGGSAAPKGLFVDLYFIAHHAAEEAGAELTVSDGQ